MPFVVLKGLNSSLFINSSVIPVPVSSISITTPSVERFWEIIILPLSSVASWAFWTRWPSIASNWPLSAFTKNDVDSQPNIGTGLPPEICRLCTSSSSTEIMLTLFDWVVASLPLNTSIILFIFKTELLMVLNTSSMNNGLSLCFSALLEISESWATRFFMSCTT